MGRDVIQKGTIIGDDFEIVRLLTSSGGVGDVYVARQRSTAQDRALKVLKSGADARLLPRFAEEARVGGQVDSKHVVEVIAAGVDPGINRPWIAMELLEGEDLHAYRKRCGALDPREVLRIFRELCHALGAAHAKGIVHRDLKPGNIFRARRKDAEGGWIIKVLDFGLARWGSGGAAWTENSIVAGSPHWSAPEQFSAGAAIGPQADVWSLGLIAFALLAGGRYWKADDPQQALAEVLQFPLVPASVRAGEFGNAQLPAGFEDWFGRCVTRAQADRFPDATAAFAALESVLTPPRSGARVVVTAREVLVVGEGESVEAVARRARLEHPKTLQFWATGHSAAEVVAILNLPELKHVNSLTLGCMKLGNKGARILAADQRVRTLTRLQLTHDSVGVDALTELLGVTEKFDISGCNIGPQGAALLAAHPRLASVRDLDLGKNALGDRGVAAIAASPHVGGLRRLHLEDNSIGDDGAVALAGSVKLPNLEWLYLGENAIGEVGTHALRDTKTLVRLAHVDVARKGATGLPPLATHGGAKYAIAGLVMFVVAAVGLAWLLMR